MGAVIDEKAFRKIDEYIADARKNARIVAGGVTKGDEGYFIAPTLVETDQRDYRLMTASRHRRGPTRRSGAPRERGARRSVNGSPDSECTAA